MASEQLGESVELEGFDFGWRTPLGIERLALGSQAAPIVEIRGISLPQTLWRTLRDQPFDASDLEIQSVTVRVTRSADGQWNFDPMLAALANRPSTGETKTTSTEPSPLPLAGAGVNIHNLSFVLDDEQTNNVLKLDEGFFQVDWPEGIQPVTLDMGGVWDLNEQVFPWDVRGKLESWIDKDKYLTIDRAKLTVSSDGMMGPQQIADGGFYSHFEGGAEPNAQVRVVLPLKHVRELLSDSPWSESIEDLGGEVDLLVLATLPEDTKSLQATVDFKGREMQGAIRAGEWLIPLMDVSAQVEASLDIESQSLRSARLNLDVAEQRLAADALWGEAGPVEIPETAHVTLDLDFAQLTSLARASAGLEQSPMLDGQLRLDVKLDSSHQFQADCHFAPRTVFTLEPFGQNPEWLGAQGLDLSPLALDLSLEGSGDLETRSFHLSSTKIESPLMKGVSLSAEGNLPVDGAPSGLARLSGEWNLGTIYEAAAPVLAGSELEGLTGVLKFNGQVEQSVDGELQTEGSMTVGSLVLKMSGWEWQEPETEAAWQLSYNPESGEAHVAQLRVAVAEGAIDVSGTAGAKSVDLKSNTRLNVTALMETSRQFATVPGDWTGVMAFDTSVRGTPGEELAIGLDVRSDEPIAARLEEVAAFEGDIGGSAEATMRWTDGRLARIEAAFADWRAGEIGGLSGSGAVDFGEPMRWAGRSVLEVNVGNVLGVVDPAIWEAQELEFLADGSTALGGEFSGVWSPEGGVRDVKVNGAWESEIAAVEFAKGGLAGWVEGITDRHAFTFQWSGGDDTPTWRDEWESGLSGGGVDPGMEWGALNAEASLEGNADGKIHARLTKLALADLTVASGQGEIVLPSIETSGAGAFDSGTQQTVLESLMCKADGLGDLNAKGYFDPVKMKWGTETVIGVEDWGAVANLIRQFVPEEIFIPVLEGRSRFEANVHGGDWMLRSDHELPVAGMVSIEAENFGMQMDDGTEIDGVDAKLSTEIDETGRLATWNASMLMNRFHNDALENKPLLNLQLQMHGSVEDWDRALVEIDQFEIPNYELRATGELQGDGLWEAARMGTEWENILNVMHLYGEVRADERLNGVSGFMPELAAEGDARATITMQVLPAEHVDISALLDIQNAGMQWADMFRASGATGTWEMGRRWVLREGARTKSIYTPGRVDIAHMMFQKPPVQVNMNDSYVTLHSNDVGMTANLTIRDVLGGAATSAWTLTKRDGDPVINGQFQFTNADLGGLSGESPEKPNRDRELSAVGSMNWKMRDVSGTRFLEDLNINAQSTFVGKGAMRTILDVMDSNGDDPRFQSAKMALRLGTPTKAEFSLVNSLISFGSELRLPAGIRVPLPILDREPLGDLAEVYELDDKSDVIELTRWGLLLLLAEDWRTLMETMNQHEATP